MDPTLEENTPYHMPSCVGWLSFSVIFNSLNTIVYGLLYPTLLKDIDDNYSSDFSTATTITTVLSAVSLPLMGTATDVTRSSRKSMLVSSLGGIVATFALVPLALTMGAEQLPYNLTFYVLSMFSLRVGVMNNNALLAVFPKSQRNGLSLLSNFLGFCVNLTGLIILLEVPDALERSWWVFVFACVASVFWIPALLYCPSQNLALAVQSSPVSVKEDDTTNHSLCSVLGYSFKRLYSTMLSLTSLELRPVILFLCAYLFFTCGAASFTIYLTVFFLDNYPVNTSNDNDDTTENDRRATEVNLYFKSALIVGVATGIFLNKHLAGKDLPLLLGQIVAYIVFFLLLIFAAELGWGYTAAMTISLGIALTYGWNMSVARSIMSKLSPPEKIGELMGFYSTFTYIGISLVSGVVSFCSAVLGYGSNSLPVLLFIFMWPSLLFLFLLYRHLKWKESENQVLKPRITENRKPLLAEEAADSEEYGS